MPSVFMLAACGFHPVHATNEPLGAALAAIEVAPAPGKLGQIVSARTQDLLTPSGKPANPQYILEMDLKRDKRELAIIENRRITRYELTITANYRLKKLPERNVVISGESKIYNSFNDLKSEFGTFVAEEDAEEKAAQELAQDLKLQIESKLGKQ